MIKNYMRKMKAKGWNFQTMKASVDTDAVPKAIQKNEEKLLPTGIKPEEDEDIQTNEEALYPMGVGLNKKVQSNQDEPEAETEQLLPAGVNPKS